MATIEQIIERTSRLAALYDNTQCGPGTFELTVRQLSSDAAAALTTMGEADCWAILTPNGSRLVSPDEAKGRKDAYPLYRRADGALALLQRIRQWDALDILYTDGAFWKREIDAVLSRVEQPGEPNQAPVERTADGTLKTIADGYALHGYRQGTKECIAFHRGIAYWKQRS